MAAIARNTGGVEEVMNYSEQQQQQLKDFTEKHPVPSKHADPIIGYHAQVWMDGIQVLGIQTITLELNPSNSTLFLRTIFYKDDPGQTVIQTRLTDGRTSWVK